MIWLDTPPGIPDEITQRRARVMIRVAFADAEALDAAEQALPPAPARYQPDNDARDTAAAAK